MTVWVYFLATALTCWLLARGRRVAAAWPLTIVSALRWNVGTDFWYTYLPEFRALEWVRGGGGDALRETLFGPLMGTMRSCGFGETTTAALDYFLQVVDRTEIGFRALMEAAIFCGGGFRAVVAVSSLLVGSCVFTAVSRQSRWPVLAAFLFVMGGSYALSLNIIRQYLAIGFCLVALDFAVRRNLVPFVVFVLVGASFHCSALLLLPSYLLTKIDLHPRWGFAAVASALMAATVVRPAALWTLPRVGLERYVWYFTDARWAGDGFEHVFFAINVCFMLLGAWYWNRVKDACPHFRMWYYLTVLGTVALAFSGVIPLMKRVNFYFAAPQFLMLPEMLLAEGDAKRRRILTALVVAAFLAEFLVAVCWLNKNEILPYGIGI